MKSTIRPAQPSDIPRLLDMIHALAAYEKLEHEAVATAENLGEFLFGKTRYAEAIFIEEESVPVGFALYFYSFSTFLGRPGIYLEDLFIQPQYRGKGYGERLLNYLAQLAVSKKLGRLEWAVLDWNKPAIEFYSRRGAQPMDEWTVYRLEGDRLNSFASENSCQK